MRRYVCEEVCMCVCVCVCVCGGGYVVSGGWIDSYI